MFAAICGLSDFRSNTMPQIAMGIHLIMLTSLLMRGTDANPPGFTVRVRRLVELLLSCLLCFLVQ